MRSLTGAFRNCVSLKRVDYVGTVDGWAEIEFSNAYANPLLYAQCLYLNGKEVTAIVLNSATKVSSYAFYNFTKLTSITIGDKVTSIGSYAFYACSGLKTLNIGSGMTTINQGALSGFESLEFLTIPFVGASGNATQATSSTLFGYIFGTSSYTGSTQTKQYYSSGSYVTYYIPTTLKSVTVTGGNILYGTFYNCANITTIVLPSNLTVIGEQAFYYCNSLTSVNIPSTVGRIEAQAFSSCSSLTRISIPSSFIGYGAFSECVSLSTVSLGSVSTIGNDAFRSCTSLTSIAIPYSVNYIGEYAFEDCNSLSSVTFGNTSGWYVSLDSTATTGKNLTLTNASTNATYLKSTYYNYFWKLG